MRAYELMIIHDGDLDDAAVQEHIKAVNAAIAAADAKIVKFDYWGRKRFAYEINHKHEGYYSVFEITAEGGALDAVERQLRIADEIVRHKLLRLPDEEAAKRGIFGKDAVAS